MTNKKAIPIVTPNRITLIINILDRSGSMINIKDDAIGGFNTFLKEQQKLPDKALMKTVLFDDEYKVLHEVMDIHKVKELTDNTFIPRGMTALHDSIGKTIAETQEYIDGLKKTKRPDQVLVVILTDGQENASKEYTQAKVKKLVTECQDKYNWNFVYLAANQDAFTESSGYGISQHVRGVNAANVLNFTGTSKGISDSYAQMSNVTTQYRSRTDADEDK